MSQRGVVILVGASLSLGACGKPANASSSSSESCTRLASQAGDRVEKVIEQHLACEADADCVSFQLSSNCFDRCERSIQRTGVDAVKAALADVDAAECRKFQDEACSFFAPPCAPPAPPKCEQGRCQ